MTVVLLEQMLPWVLIVGGDETVSNVPVCTAAALAG